MNKAEVSIFYQRVGERIRMAREMRGQTQEALAKAIGLSRPSLVNIEQGRQQVLAHHIHHVARVLGIKPGTLIG